MTIAERFVAKHTPAKPTRTRLCKALTMALLVAVPWGLQAKVDESLTYEPVAPTIDQARANILIARQLQFTHFRNLASATSCPAMCLTPTWNTWMASGFI